MRNWASERRAHATGQADRAFPLRRSDQYWRAAGFGAKTGCTNNASVEGLSEASCDAIDTWAWGGLITMLALIVIDYAALVPRWLHEAVLLATIALVVIVATLGMVSVQPM